MTRQEFDDLPVGTKVWFKPGYFAYRIPGTVKIFGRGESAIKGIWVNFFGDGQCFFAHGLFREDRFYSFVSRVIDGETR